MLALSGLLAACPQRPPETPRDYVLDVAASQITPYQLFFDHGVYLGDQLDGDHPVAPSGWAAYLISEEVRRLRELGVLVLDPADFPAGTFPVPVDDDLLQCLTSAPAEGRFCSYSEGPTASCTINVVDQLGALSAAHAGLDLVDLGTTSEGVTIWGARLGGPPPAAGAPPRPQVVVFANQHAREWITVEVAMEIIRHYAAAYDSDPEVRARLDSVSLVVVPSSNPDGYNYTFTDRRRWRANLGPCAGGIGVDPNRNFPFNHGQPGSGDACRTSDDTTYHGSSTDPERETQAARGLLAAAGAGGAYVTAFALNLHSYGSLVLFSDGSSAGFAPCTTNTNCSNADLAAGRVLGGTWRQPRFRTERGGPYRASQLYRNLYPTSGDVTTDGQYGALPGGAPRVMGLGVELGDPSCRFAAERFPEPRIWFLARQQIEYVGFLLGIAPDLVNGSWYDREVGAYALPHLHRRSAAGEHPTLRLAARKTIPSVSFFAEDGDPADGFPDDVLEGVAYRSWAWRPTGDPYKFPARLRVCSQAADCLTAVMPGGGGGGASVDICNPGFFVTVDGWEHVGRAADVDTPQKQCYWTRDGRTGPGPWTLETGSFDLVGMREATLVFTIFHGFNGVDIEVQMTTTDFTACGTPGSACRVVYDSRPEGVVDVTREGFRTRIVDIGDFDGRTGVRVRYVLRGESPEVEIYDPVILGWG